MIETAQIEKLSTPERLGLMEQLWDGLRRDEAGVPSPQWHGEVLEARKTAAESGEARFLTLGQLRARLHVRFST